MSEHKPLVTIITLTCNRPLLFERAVKSVLSLNYESWEHVTVNNGGDANTVSNILTKYSAEYCDRSHFIDLDSSLSTGAALNVAIRSSQSNYILVLDDDDSIHPDILLRLTGSLENSLDSIKAVHCSTNIIDEFIISNKVFLAGIRDNPYHSQHANLYNLFSHHNFTPTSYLFKRSVFDEIGFFDETNNLLPVWDFWIRLLSVFETNFVADKLAGWHNRPFSKDEYSNLKYSSSHDEMANFRIKYINRLILNAEPSSVSTLAALGLAHSSGGSRKNELNHVGFSYRLLPQSFAVKLKNVFFRKINA